MSMILPITAHPIVIKEEKEKTNAQGATKPIVISSAPVSEDKYPIGSITSGNATTFMDSITPSKIYTNLFNNHYKVVDNKGVNEKNARTSDIVLAKYSKAVAEDMDMVDKCYTGVKHALWSAGVLNDYADMPRGDAKNATEYFDANPEKFEKVKVAKEDLSKLSAGHIVVYKKDGLPGHIAITNGNGQETSDHTDNMKWLEEKGDGSTFEVYKLTDKWQYNEQTRKLEFNKNATKAPNGSYLKNIFM